jgi:hypothetical protein
MHGYFVRVKIILQDRMDGLVPRVPEEDSFGVKRSLKVVFGQYAATWIAGWSVAFWKKIGKGFFLRVQGLIGLEVWRTGSLWRGWTLIG